MSANLNLFLTRAQHEPALQEKIVAAQAATLDETARNLAHLSIEAGLPFTFAECLDVLRAQAQSEEYADADIPPALLPASDAAVSLRVRRA